MSCMHVYKIFPFVYWSITKLHYELQGKILSSYSCFFFHLRYLYSLIKFLFSCFAMETEKHRSVAEPFKFILHHEKILVWFLVVNKYEANYHSSFHFHHVSFSLDHLLLLCDYIYLINTLLQKRFWCSFPW